MFYWAPWCYDVEEAYKYATRKVFRPCMRKLGLYAIFCECAPALKCWSFTSKYWKKFASFRWLCDWCPPVILRLKAETTADDEDGDAEAGDKDDKDDDKAEEE